MNKPDFRFSSIDTVFSATLVAVMAVGCAVLLSSQGVQIIVA